MKTLTAVPAPAKLNLFLHVTGRRPDGYHLLETVFQFVDLCDLFDFELSHNDEIVVSGTDQIPLAGNLIFQAARLLQKTTNTKYGAYINCQKKVPMGGGLGGGSSNAATTLLALNRLWGTGLKRKDILALALRLGADVPVFVYGQSAFARGVGEQLSPVTIRKQAYLLVKPRTQVSTADVFSQQDLTRGTESVKISSFTDWQTKQNGFFGHNDLQATVFKLRPVIASTWQFLSDMGIDTRMTGSGACLFAEFKDLSAARMQQDRIISKIGQHSDLIEQTWVCSGLTHHPLWGWLDD